MKWLDINEKEYNEIWQKYQKCLDYMQKKCMVSNTDMYWNFYLGEQWKNLQSGDVELPQHNFIKPVVRYKVATVAQNSLVPAISDLQGRTDEVTKQICELLEKDYATYWEKAKMDIVKWDLVKAGAVQGDSYLYFGTTDGLEAQILSNCQMMLGDENQNDIQKQPYIILAQRLTVKEVKAAAKKNKVPEEEIAMIGADKQKDTVIGNKAEVGGEDSEKCTAVIYFEKKDGVVHVARAVKECIYQPLEPLAVTQNGQTVGGLHLYPIVSFVWEKIPNNARGNSEVKQLLPNQIELNKTLARRSMSVKMTAFPRIAYDATAIQNEDDLQTVGAAIAMQGASSNIDQMIKYLNPASMSHDAATLQQDLLDTSMNLAGAQDTALGNIDPQRVSGTAIEAIRDQSALPLNEQISAYRQFAEDLAMLRYEFLIYNAPADGVSITFENELGEEMEATIPVEELENFKPFVRIDISPDNAWSKYSEQQELANLLNNQLISLEEYVELLPKNSALPVNKLKTVIGRRAEQVGGEENVPMQEVSSDLYGPDGVPEALPVM